ncbi:hypothetical protein COBT_002114 [Conglomerata obtusa]
MFLFGVIRGIAPSKKRCHDIVKKVLYRDELVIGGDGITVETDESKFCKRKYHIGHRVHGVWVLGMVERTTTKRIILLEFQIQDGIHYI